MGKAIRYDTILYDTTLYETEKVERVMSTACSQEAGVVHAELLLAQWERDRT